MKLAIMQPYLFPYIGYFQLINAVDKFVIYDDVNFIKQGWINRNTILVQEKRYLFTVPLINQSSFSKINEIFVNNNLYNSWRAKTLRTLEQSYKKAPFFKEIYDLVVNVLDIDMEVIDIATLARKSLLETSKYLDINTEFVFTSSIYENQELSGKTRVIDICRKEKALQYINPIGGQELYDRESFRRNELELSFIKTLPLEYKQFKNEFAPWLSIIDVLMFNSIEETKLLLNKYELV
jgi:hypothetical protein